MNKVSINYLKVLSILFFLAFVFWMFQGCSLFKAEPKKIGGSGLKKLSLRQYPEFKDDMDYNGLGAAIQESLAYLGKLPPDRTFRFDGDVYDTRHMIKTLTVFLHFLEAMPSKEALNTFIRSHFYVYTSRGGNKSREVLFTGYYEPALEGSASQSPAFPYPVFPRPADHVVIELSLFDPRFGNEKPLIGRIRDDRKIIPYYERREITPALLAGKAEPLAYVKDQVDLFFLQIQGSGKIYMDGGDPIQVHYHTSNGHPYKSIGALLIREGKILKEDMSMQKIRSYLHEHPEEVDDILNHNPSYVFFRLEKDGPFGCYGTKVTAGRSIALEKRIFPAAAVGFMTSQKPFLDDAQNIQEWRDFSRFVLNQDTGGAIKGPGRADLFWGNGPYAEIAAGYMQHPGHLYFFVLKQEGMDQNE